MRPIKSLGKRPSKTHIALHETTFLDKVRLHDLVTIIDGGREKEVPAGRVKPPEPLRPQLFLVEHYQLTSFKGDLARDDLIGSFSLSPNSELTYTLIRRTISRQASEFAETVMESRDQSAQKSLNEHLKQSADSRFGKNNSNYHLDLNFHGEGQVGFGSASADAQLNVSGGSQEVREDFASSVESAIDSQITTTAKFRTQKAVSGTIASDHLEENEVRTEKKTRNPTSEPINVGIFQLKEEVISILSLVDMSLAFRNTNGEQDQTVPLRDIDRILDSVIAKVEDRVAIKRQVRDVAESVFDYLDEVRSIVLPQSADAEQLAVNRRLESTYELKTPDGTARRSVKVPGIITKVLRRYIVKPNTAVELKLGYI